MADPVHSHGYHSYWAERSGIICFISYVIGLLFVTNAGVYFLELFLGQRVNECGKPNVINHPP